MGTGAEKIVAADRSDGASFGICVAMNGNYAIIGATNDSNLAGAALYF